jgi:NAD(P)-dependent dehydrogenase (short-subunit alcohol dehydrogenase family)
MSGKVVLVTGGTSGIGRAAAHAFATAGAAVAIAGRRAGPGESVLRELEASGAPAIFVRADVTRAHDVMRLVDEVVSRFGRLDCAFNNAASIEAGLGKDTAEVEEAEFDRALEIGLKSVWLCMKHELRQMVAQGGGGAIVNTSSVNGFRGSPNAAPYAAAKAGVISLTTAAAAEYARHAIRVNAIAPGVIDTPMQDQVAQLAGGGASARARAAGAAPLGRMGLASEAAAAVLWLCSGAAAYVTGHTLVVDGGLTTIR